MRDPKRIPLVLASVETVWVNFPDLRLGQLLNVIAVTKDMDTFYIEDEEVMDICERWSKSKGPNISLA